LEQQYKDKESKKSEFLNAGRNTGLVSELDKSINEISRKIHELTSQRRDLENKLRELLEKSFVLDEIV
jgi:hypothetical protein